MAKYIVVTDGEAFTYSLERAKTAMRFVLTHGDHDNAWDSLYTVNVSDELVKVYPQLVSSRKSDEGDVWVTYNTYVVVQEDGLSDRVYDEFTIRLEEF